MILSTIGLSARYHRGPAFHFPDLQLPAASCLAICGPTGCGKSTLLNSLFQWQFPGTIRGEVWLSGQRLSQLTRPEIYRQVAYLPQFAQASFNPLLKVATHFDHVLAGSPQLAPPDYLSWLAELQLEPGVLQLYPAQLSGGMKQRLALVLALLRSPRLLVLDELTNGVDVVSLCLAMRLLQRQRQAGLAILLVSHELGFTRRLADRIVVLGGSVDRDA